MALFINISNIFTQIYLLTAAAVEEKRLTAWGLLPLLLMMLSRTLLSVCWGRREGGDMLLEVEPGIGSAWNDTSLLLSEN